jgi:hypothetical protein
MRSYLDIIIDLKDGKEVSYEEARLTALAGNYMLQFAENDIVRMTGYATDKQKEDFQSKIAIKNYEDRFYSKKIPVEEYLGNWHPDAPSRQKEREFNQKIFEKFLKER